MLKGKHVRYYKLQQNFGKEVLLYFVLTRTINVVKQVAFLMDHPIPDNTQKLSYQLQNIEEAKLDIKGRIPLLAIILTLKITVVNLS